MGFKLIYLFLLLPLLTLTILSRADHALASDKKLHESHRNRTVLAGAGRVKIAALKGRKQTSDCNLFQGRWVFDASYPFYDSSACPFIDGEFDCLKFGRPDRQFLKYSWQPDSCTIPRFDGQAFLNKWRGKRVMFVGDSLSQNMWESLGCMIHASVPDTKTTFLKHTPVSSLTFQEYGVTIYLYRTPYLVDISKESVGRVLNLGTIEGGADVWKDMDILVFNSWHWWLHKGVELQGWDYIRNGSSLIRDMDRLDAFSKGLATWAQWVDQNVNISQTRVFFQGISPTHYVGKEWNEPKNTCNGQMQPLSGSTYPGGSLPAASIVSRVLSSMKTPVYLLDITTLSQLRKDAHPSTYGGGGGTDCSHWCLPGLPDTWNQLLYAALSYHLGRGHIGMTMKSQLYRLLEQRAAECRYFVIPLWRGSGYITMFAQVEAPHMIFTGLEDYKARGTQAAPYLTSTFYTELSETKDLVFIRGDVVFTSKLTDEEAKWIMETAQSFYLNDTRYKLLERFNKHTHEFEFKDVLQALDMPIL